jgi:hypothetical protein
MKLKQRFRSANHLHPPGPEHAQRDGFMFRWTVHPHESDLVIAAWMLQKIRAPLPQSRNPGG